MPCRDQPPDPVFEGDRGFTRKVAQAGEIDVHAADRVRRLLEARLEPGELRHEPAPVLDRRRRATPVDDRRRHAVASSDAGTVRRMSSSWIGSNRFGRSGCSEIGWPASMNSRCQPGHPPLSPYGTLRRATVVGTLLLRATARATTSAEIFARLYVGNITRGCHRADPSRRAHDQDPDAGRQRSTSSAGTRTGACARSGGRSTPRSAARSRSQSSSPPFATARFST